uniref:Carboxypeptidase n=1 Tax=Branchiostoma floridae TaxID=7739 RepID=C3ZZZ2_BRAFL|eukprot:XP_002585881.1 hypothetical protein BRAFLDRAFT_110967 [Branchiostoma floridae]
MQGLRCSIVFLVVILVSQKSTAVSPSNGGPFRPKFPRVHHDIQEGQDYGDPLYLTPYLEQGMAQKAKTLSEVHLPGTSVKSYSGYLTVNKAYNSNLFFWFFPALVSNKTYNSNKTYSGNKTYNTNKTYSSNLFFWFFPALVSNKTYNSNKTYSGNKTYNTNKTYSSNLFFWFFPALVNNKTYNTNKTYNSNKTYNTNKTYSSNLFFWFFPALVSNKTYNTNKTHNSNKTYNTNKTYSGNLLFWFFHALISDKTYNTNKTYSSNKTYKSYKTYNLKTDPENAPLLLFLEGGPGATAMYGIFTETGPFYITKDAQWKYVPALSYKIHIENPTAKFKINFKGMAIGNGWCDPINQYHALPDFMYNTGMCNNKQAFQLGETVNLMETQVNEKLYIQAFESYAGKYVPALSYKIHMENPTATLKINFKGMAIGNGWCDPINVRNNRLFQLDNQYRALPDFMYNTGMCNNKQAFQLGETVNLMETQVNEKLYIQAFETFDALIGGALTPYPTLFYNITGGSNYFNYLRTVEPPEQEYFWTYLAKPGVRKAIHAGNLTLHDGIDVLKHLLMDFMQPVVPQLITIMDNNYKVLMYNGQLDVIVAGVLTEAFLQRLPWSKLDQYQAANRTVWKINPSDTDVAGFALQVDNFYQVIVKGGGHILPFDQPERAFDMIDRFVSGKGFQ